VAHRPAARQVIRSVAAAVVVGVALLAAAPVHAAFPGANGKLVFWGSVSGTSGLYTMNPDTTGRALLYAGGTWAQWSPDGQQVVFSGSGPGGCVWTCKINADGTGLTQLTGCSATPPSWSPDATKIACIKQDLEPQSGQYMGEIYTMNSDGTNLTRLTYFSGTCPQNEWGQQGPCPIKRHPSWSPDGSKIAYSVQGYYYDDEYLAWVPGSAHIEVVSSTDGSLIASGGYFDAWWPDWSPDGTRIVFYAPSATSRIYVMNADGTGAKALTRDSDTSFARADRDPVWSPDGRKIAFTRVSDINQVTNQQLWLMNADGSGQTIVATPDHPAYPSWQPLPTAAYEHPQSASSLSASLVPTFRPCGTGTNPTNGQHSPPLGTQSCLPPTPGSNVARVGSTSTGSASFTVVPGDSDATNGDQANVTLTASLSDVKTTAGADYVPNASGPDLSEITRLRLTDKANNYGGASGTATEYDFRVPLDCAATSDPAVGSTCSTSTSADSLLPGFITEQRRTVVQAFRVRIDDAGANGTTGDSDDRIFATQGIYIP
jgi:Tol biopolymer transport system component